MLRVESTLAQDMKVVHVIRGTISDMNIARIAHIESQNQNRHQQQEKKDKLRQQKTAIELQSSRNHENLVLILLSLLQNEIFRSPSARILP